MLSLLAIACLSQGQAPIVPIPRPGLNGRGRDPWVFRAVFEDRTRMVILAPAPNWWMAFNPETCAMHKVWRGKMDFRGKVWDFSQNNSRAEGRIYLASPSELWRLPDKGPLPEGWKATGVTSQADGRVFANDQSTIESPPVDASNWQRVFVGFDETGRKGRFHVSIGGAFPQWFDSATSVESETAWQWNFKRIEQPSGNMVVKIQSKAAGKKLRNFRMYGDRPGWSDSKGRPISAIFEGYELVKQTQAVVIRYRLQLAGGGIVNVEHRPELTPTGWEERLAVRGVPPGDEVVYTRTGLSEAVRSNSGLTGIVQKRMRNGEHVLKFDLPAGER